MRNDENYGRRSTGGDDEAIRELLERRRRHREYDDFLEGYKGRADDYDDFEDDRYIGTREGRAARRVLDEGRVTSGRSREYSAANRRESYAGRSANSSRRYTGSNNRVRYDEQYDYDEADSFRRLSASDVVKRFGLSILLIAASVVILYFTTMNLLTAGINRVDIDTTLTVEAAEEVADIPVRSNTSSVKNVLLLGIDDDGGSGSRSDTIMIASVDTKNGTVRLCSILRDNYVSIPGHRKNRINSAYAFGGAQLTLQTIEANYRIHIDDFVSVDMEAMRHIVDAIGGVTITITEAEAGQINRYSWSNSPDVSAGEMLLDGKQAVCYAQIRKIDSDFGRTNRQRVLIGAIVEKCRSISVFELMGLVNTVSPYLTTNMSSSQIATLAVQVMPALGGELGQMSLPVDGTYSSQTIREMSVLVSDLEENTRMLHQFIYGE